MIKSNKPKNIFRLPRIPMPLNSHQFSIDQPEVQIICTKPKKIQNNAYFKQNNIPKDLKGNTIYLEFPIKKKKLSIDVAQQLKIQKLTNQGIFINRAICSHFRRDVRAKMYKYDEERTQIMTQRVGNYCSDSQHIILRQLISKQTKKSIQSKKIEVNFQQKRRSSSLKMHGINENVTRWENGDISKQQKQQDEIVLQQFVEKYKKSKIY